MKPSVPSMLLAVAACIGLDAVHAAPRYTVRDLTDIIGGSTYTAVDINDNGLIAGNRLAGGMSSPVLFDGSTGALTELATPRPPAPGHAIHSGLFALNNAGQAVGQSHYQLDAFEYSVARGTYHSPGFVPTDIGSFASNYLQQVGAWAISENGVATGYGYNEAANRTRAITYSPGTGLVELPTPDGYDSLGVGINDAGHVIGQLQGDTQTDYFYYDGTTMAPLLGPDGGRLNGLAINNAGWITGAAYEGGRSVPYLYNPGSGWINLATVGTDAGFINAHGQALNETGEVVGSGWDGSAMRAFFFDADDGMHTLNSLLTAEFAGWDIVDASAINASGQIIATALFGGERRSVLLNAAVAAPVPDAPAWGLMLVGIAGLALRRRKAG